MANKRVINEAGKTAYEIMVILPNDLGDQKTKGEIEAVKTLITERDGEVTHEDLWGSRNLAFPMRGYDAGYYFVLNFILPGNKLSDLNKSLRLNTILLRFLISATPTDYKPLVLNEDKERLGLHIELRDLSDIDSLFKKREDKFEKNPDKKGRPEAPAKTAPEVRTPVVEKPVKVAPKIEEKAPVKKVTPVVEEAPKEEAKPAKKAVVKEAPKEEENAEDRLAELDRKLDELLNKDL
ncbi:MAG: 30S ribosomal protein S6 [Candidatus Gracilibacteria bacterium]|nr:30S ribosomal protein S6 [Candidatus Gracilibacteria bacterium]